MPATLPDIRYTNLIEELGPLPTKPCKVELVSSDSGSEFYFIGRVGGIHHEAILAAIEVCDLAAITGEKPSDFGGKHWNATIYLGVREYQTTDYSSYSDAGFMQAARCEGVTCPIFQCNSVSSRGALRYARRAFNLIDKNLEDFLEVPCNNMGSNGSDFLKGELVSRPANANHLNKPW
jgi:hypothetical protein